MSRSLSVAALAVLASLSLSTAFATTAASKPAAKKTAKAAAEPVSATDDNLNPNQLTLADRVLVGEASCELKQKVEIERVEGHAGNFKLTFNHKSYVMVPEETTTGAIRLVDTGGSVVWVQIPMKSMLMNQREHHRMVDDCQEDEQRIAVQASQKAGANAAVLAPSVAASAAVVAAQGGVVAQNAVALANGATVTSTETTTVTTRVVATPPAQRAAAAPATAASGMWK